MAKPKLSTLILGGPDGYERSAAFETRDDPDGVYVLDGPGDIEGLQTQLVRTSAQGAQPFLNTLKNVRVTGNQLPPVVAAHYDTMSGIAQGLSNAMQKLEADYMRRPNQWCGLRTGVLAPTGVAAFDLNPANGQNWYRVLNFAVADNDCRDFGFTSLKIGGMEHINAAQTLPGGITFAAPMIGFQIKESSNIHHLMPWVGDAFDNTVHLTGSIVNLTSLAASDASSRELRMQVGVQTDPCGQNYTAMRGASAVIRANIAKRMQYFLQAA